MRRILYNIFFVIILVGENRYIDLDGDIKKSYFFDFLSISFINKNLSPWLDEVYQIRKIFETRA